jgi:hypothetical protein
VRDADQKSRGNLAPDADGFAAGFDAGLGVGFGVAAGL